MGLTKNKKIIQISVFCCSLFALAFMFLNAGEKSADFFQSDEEKISVQEQYKNLPPELQKNIKIENNRAIPVGESVRECRKIDCLRCCKIPPSNFWACWDLEVPDSQDYPLIVIPH